MMYFFFDNVKRIAGWLIVVIFLMFLLFCVLVLVRAVGMVAVAIVSSGLFDNAYRITFISPSPCHTSLIRLCSVFDAIAVHVGSSIVVP